MEIFFSKKRIFPKYFYWGFFCDFLINFCDLVISAYNKSFDLTASFNRMNVNVYGPNGTKQMLGAAHSFMRFEKSGMRLETHEFGDSLPGKLYEDFELSVHSIPLYGEVFFLSAKWRPLPAKWRPSFQNKFHFFFSGITIDNNSKKVLLTCTWCIR